MVLVTGGTGLVGAHLLLHLLKKEQAVRAIHRQNSDLKQVKNVFSYYEDNYNELFDKIEWIVADITDIPSLELAFKNITDVYHCAALISFDPNDYYKLQNINVKGTANIVNLSLAYGIKKLGYISSIAALGKNEVSSDITEQSEWNDANANVYALTKYAAELEVWRGTQEGLDAVIVNPGVILGPGFWKTGSGKLFSKTARGLTYYPPNGTGFIAVNDVVKMIVELMESTIKNENYIAVAKNMTYKEVLSRISVALGKPRPKKELKIWQLNMLSKLDWLVTAITRRERKLSKMQVKGLKRQEIYDSEKIKKVLDFKYADIESVIIFASHQFLQENP